MRRMTLRQRVLLWMAIYVVVLCVIVTISGFVVHERAEHMVWKELLESELDHIVRRNHEEPDYRWQDSGTLSLYRINTDPELPAVLKSLRPGLYDAVYVQDQLSTVLVRDVPELGRVALVLDIADFTEMERFVERWVLLASVSIALITVVMTSVAMKRIVRPLSELTEHIRQLNPGALGQRVGVNEKATPEMAVIADAVNDYLQRNDRFVERERVFINTASHELRTPIAVILGAAELAQEQPDVPAAVRAQVQRISHNASGVQQLIMMLLVLAREPGKLAEISGMVDLDQLLPEVVSDHMHLAKDKELRLILTALPPCRVSAPFVVVQTAIGNLLRNAIENSDSGEIRIELRTDATVIIDEIGR
ncbi:MAG: HAMP domain-containing histidine kinase, partial [Xanthomonadaceae bacterium]|nr:HAMP domain-containing histidine kinase [Xanthomonadaceae bacterium]